MGPGSLQFHYLKLVAPLPSHCYNKTPRSTSFLGNKYPNLAFQLDPFNPWNNLKISGHKLHCIDNFSDFSGEEELSGKVQATNQTSKNLNEGSSMSSLPSKMEVLEPSLLGIKPDPPDWPERNDIERIRIESRANRLEIPLSLKIIMKKRKWQKGSNFSFCSAKKAFSHMVFMVRELQSHALQIRENLYSEDLQGVIGMVQVEMNASFVWLFQQVFSRTPTLMVYVMLLLANFTVHSMVGHNQTEIKASPLPTYYQQTIPDETISTNQPNPGVVVLPGRVVQDFTKGELEIWKSIVEEASRMSMFEVFDPEMMKRIVSSLKVNLEPDDYEVYHRTDLVYQMALADDPCNSLLLCNYAQFLYLVPRDFDGAEECFKRGIMMEPNDAELSSRYADFLWLIRKDLWGAERMYLQALAAEPDSQYHASNYATFLWSTGGEETCFPIDNLPNDNYDNNEESQKGNAML